MKSYQWSSSSSPDVEHFDQIYFQIEILIWKIYNKLMLFLWWNFIYDWPVEISSTLNLCLVQLKIVFLGTCVHFHSNSKWWINCNSFNVKISLNESEKVYKLKHAFSYVIKKCILRKSMTTIDSSHVHVAPPMPQCKMENCAERSCMMVVARMSERLLWCVGFWTGMFLFMCLFFASTFCTIRCTLRTCATRTRGMFQRAVTCRCF